MTTFHRQKLEPPPLSQAKVVTLGAAVIHLLASTLDPLSKEKKGSGKQKKKIHRRWGRGGNNNYYPQEKHWVHGKAG